MKHLRQIVILFALMILGFGVGSFALRNEDPEKQAVSESEIDFEEEVLDLEPSEETLDWKVTSEPELLPPGALLSERVLSFVDQASFLEFLKILEDLGIEPLSTIDALRSVRIRTGQLERIDLSGLEPRLSYSFPVYWPSPPSGADPALLANLQAFGLSANEIASAFTDGDGDGVTVAILDSGLDQHASFLGLSISRLDLSGLGLSGPGAEHGTSVTSIIAGEDGLAPAADILAIRVLDERGIGSSFQVSKGIVAAVDAGADLINLSLGSYEDSLVMGEAVDYALSRGVVLVAAAGNEGLDRLPYPAAYEDVLSVTAVDGAGRQALFPNQSVQIDFAAPGVGIETAAEESLSSLFSGTSAAVPFVTGTLAALMSGPNALDARSAVEVLEQNLNDAGAPGDDPQYGAGVLDWNRIRERETSGVLDLAVAGFFLDPGALPGTTMPVQVTVQNRGTTWISHAELESKVEGMESIVHSIGSLGPGQTTTRQVFVKIPSEYAEEGLRLAARVLTEDAEEDVRLENNIKAVDFRPR